MSEPGQPTGDRERSRVVSGLLAGLALFAGLGGPIGAAVALASFAFLVGYRLTGLGDKAPRFPRPRASLEWVRALGHFVADFVAWAAPHVPFVAPVAVFVAVTWPLPQASQSLRFQEQASQIILVLVIGYAIEAGAIRWRRRTVDWVLSLMTVGILLAGEVYALVDLATDNPDHADIIAGSMAAGVVAILITAIQGSARRDEDEPGAG